MNACTFTSSDPSVAAVNAAGKIVGKKAGTATITVKTYNGHAAECTVRVWKAPSKVAVSRKTATMAVGMTLQLSSSVSPAGANPAVTWSTSNKKIATVDRNGLVTAKKAGKVKIGVKEKYTINTNDKYFMIRASNVSTSDGSAYLWWFNGTNHGSSVKPTKVQTLTGGDVMLYWDITSSGLDDKCQGQSYAFSQGNTIFGLTSTTGTSVIKYIGFNSAMSMPTNIRELSMNPFEKSGVYSLNGYHLTSTQKGINIVNGEKILVK
jgi:hypothetical protein